MRTRKNTYAVYSVSSFILPGTRSKEVVAAR